MARQILTKTVSPAGRNITALVAMTMTAEDTTNHSRFLYTGHEILVAQNQHAATGYTVTIVSTADPHGRTGDITAQAIAAQQILVFGPSVLEGWVQSDGYIYVTASNASVFFGVLTIPG